MTSRKKAHCTIVTITITAAATNTIIITTTAYTTRCFCINLGILPLLLTVGHATVVRACSGLLKIVHRGIEAQIRHRALHGADVRRISQSCLGICLNMLKICVKIYV